ncbi:hypothetical protein [Corallococcus exercitus]|uniref:hypothetical protein n=1 Tax=Corallococcus exercitus TaxID=2316736 RepID=UPI0034627E7C
MRRVKSNWAVILAVCIFAAAGCGEPQPEPDLDVGAVPAAEELTAVKVPLAVSAGACHSLFLRKDGVVWAWGQNVSGQLGTGNTSSTPQEPPPLAEPVKRFLASEEDSQPSSRAPWLKWLAVSEAGSLIAAAAWWWS